MDRFCCLVIRVPGYRPRGPGFDSRCYQIFWEVVGLERGPLSLVKITEELLECKSSGSGSKNRDYGRGDPLRWPGDTLYQLKLALTSPTGCGRSAGIVRLRTKTTEFYDIFKYLCETRTLCVMNSHGSDTKLWGESTDLSNSEDLLRAELHEHIHH
jgi:hypothetical protein